MPAWPTEGGLHGVLLSKDYIGQSAAAGRRSAAQLGVVPERGQIQVDELYLSLGGICVFGSGQLLHSPAHVVAQGLAYNCHMTRHLCLMPAMEQHHREAKLKLTCLPL